MLFNFIFQYYFDRNLDTQDIPGSQPGTLQSKVVKNKEMAQKITGFRQKIGKLII